MKPWFLKFLFVSVSASLLIIAIGTFANRASSNVSGGASAIDSFSSNDSEETSIPEPEVDSDQPAPPTEATDSIEPVVSHDDQLPVLPTAQNPAPIISVPISPPVVFTPPAPTFISVPSGGAISQPANPVSVAPIESHLEISVASEPVVPPVASSTESVASSTPEIEYICTIHPDASSTAETAHIVISELFIDMVGADTQEFIKLYNPTDHDISLASSSLQYLSGTATGLDKAVKKNFSPQAQILTKGFYLIGTGDYAGPAPDMIWSQALSNTGATVFLVGNAELITSLTDADIIDHVVYSVETLPPAGETLKLFNP